jgi:carbonic anhydrase
MLLFISFWSMIISASLTSGCIFKHRDNRQTLQKENFSYQSTTGPTHWHLITAGNELCATGKFQSPVNVVTNSSIFLLTTGVAICWPDNLLWDIVHNGYTVEILPKEKIQLFQVIIEQKAFALLQCHFHTPGEHRIDGVSSPLEMHCVFQDIICMFPSIIGWGLANWASFFFLGGGGGMSTR